MVLITALARKKRDERSFEGRNPRRARKWPDAAPIRLLGVGPRRQKFIIYSAYYITVMFGNTCLKTIYAASRTAVRAPSTRAVLAIVVFKFY